MSEQFFYDHAGWSYDPKKETSEEGKRRTAAELTKAEQWASDNDYEFVWSDDVHDDDKTVPPTTCESCQMIIDGEYVSGLGCVDDADDDYRRVIQAELALNVMERQSESL